MKHNIFSKHCQYRCRRKQNSIQEHVHYIVIFVLGSVPFQITHIIYYFSAWGIVLLVTKIITVESSDHKSCLQLPLNWRGNMLVAVRNIFCSMDSPLNSATSTLSNFRLKIVHICKRPLTIKSYR